MTSFQPGKRHLWELVIKSFNLNKSAAKAHRLILEEYRGAASSKRSCLQWFYNFKNTIEPTFTSNNQQAIQMI